MVACTAILILCISAMMMNVRLVVPESALHTSEPAPATVLPPTPQLRPDCSSLIISMIDCLPFVTPGSTVNKPQGTCCSSLKTVLETDAKCVCEASKISPQYPSIKINITKALALPSACHIEAPSPSICGISAGNVTAPVGSPTTDAFEPPAVLAPTSASQTSDSSKLVVLGSTIGTLMLLVAIGFIMYAVHKRKRDADMEEEYPDQVPGMPSRFTYEELKTATENFSKKLGEGGYGSVFEGTLGDGTKIAVKCLESLARVNKSFLAEVRSTGSIHHVNLVRLLGFCIGKSQRFLVYDFMSNGSLDRWIYHGVREHILEWECRKKIILDISKGLAYLHEECRQKIVHLDIKPQNILLDNDFNAKVSDFGLSKLIDKNQTQVTSTIKGTPGYIAPEWRSSIITEKLDVYSFGIVLLEILCGRKIFDRSEPEEESQFLLFVFEKCWEQGTLLDMVDRHSEDMQVHNTEVVEMMKIASWCLQRNYKRRPSMSSVVKVLEGVMNVESNLDYNFTDLRIQETEVGDEIDCTQLPSSILSGPR